MTTSIPHLDIIDDEMAAILRRKSEAERLAIAHGMWSSARRLIFNVLRSEYPDWPLDKIELEVARRLSHGAV